MFNAPAWAPTPTPAPHQQLHPAARTRGKLMLSAMSCDARPARDVVICSTMSPRVSEGAGGVATAIAAGVSTAATVAARPHYRYYSRYLKGPAAGTRYNGK